MAENTHVPPAQPQPTVATTEPAITKPLQSTTHAYDKVGKKSMLALIVALLFFAGGLGTWVYVEYFFK